MVLSVTYVMSLMMIAYTTLGFCQEQGHHQILDFGLSASLRQHELFLYDLYIIGFMLFLNRKCVSHIQKCLKFGQLLTRPWLAGTETKEACTKKLQSQDSP